MDIQNITKLIDAVSNSCLTVFEIEDGDFKILMETNKGINEVSVYPKTETSVLQLNEVIKPMQAEVKPAGNIVTSPIVGVFYVASSEDAQPFVTVGSTVTKGQTIGIVEAMKLMNEVESDFEGVVEEILVTNGQMVEFGQPLIRVR